jgi:hypothetical protein
VERISSDAEMDSVFHCGGGVMPAWTVMMAQMNQISAVSDTSLQVVMPSVIRHV